MLSVPATSSTRTPSRTRQIQLKPPGDTWYWHSCTCSLINTNFLRTIIRACCCATSHFWFLFGLFRFLLLFRNIKSFGLYSFMTLKLLFFYYLSNQPKHQLKKRKKESYSALDRNRKHHSELQSTKCVISAPRSVPLSTIGRVNGVSLTVTPEIIRDLGEGGGG